MTDKGIPDSFKEKLFRALKAEAVLSERSKQLKKQVEDLRTREQTMHHLASELLERQRELNFMLNRASSVLHQLQDTNLALSAEFSHIVKELPPAKDAGWEDTIARVNELFKKTHELAGEMQDEILGKAFEPEPAKERAVKAEKPAATPPPVSEPLPESPEFEYQLETELAEPEFQPALEPELEPQAELVEPELQPEIEPELEPQEELVEPELQPAVELEPEPQEVELEAIEEHVVEAEEEELVEVHPKFDQPSDDQIEQAFRLFQPIELKPLPNSKGRNGEGKGVFSKLFRRNKTAA